MRKTRGFTLIEMAIMIGVASVLIISITRSMQTTVWRFTRLRSTYIALNLAKKQMAMMNHEALPGNGTTNPASDASFPNFTYTQVVATPYTTGAPASNVRKIEMQVSTTTDGQLISLITYRDDIAAFGDGV